MKKNNINRKPNKTGKNATDNMVRSKTAINHKIIGQRIREEREKLALSRAEFAEIIELSDYYIGQLERGERQMSFNVMLKIAACLHISLDFLVFGSTRYCNIAENETAPSLLNENSQAAELKLLLEKCSEKELEMIKKLIQTILPYIRQYTK
jgi:transcriptional regulator with XRE-family HTH domain